MRQRIKIEGVRRDGAEIQLTGMDSEERHALALRLVEERGLVMVEPYDDPAIIAGQGTCGLEIVEDLPAVTSVLVPVSGGGLSAGVATAVKALAPSARVIGVEPELAADGKASLESGTLVTWTAEQTGRTMADGLRTNSLGPLPFEHLRRFMDEIVTVSEEEMAEAMRQLATRARLVVEPSGAAGDGRPPGRLGAPHRRRRRPRRHLSAAATSTPSSSCAFLAALRPNHPVRDPWGGSTDA